MKYAPALAVTLSLGLAACSGRADHEGLQKQIQTCGAQPYHFYQPEMGVIGPAPAGDAVAGQRSPEAEKCVLDWARENGFTVLTAEDIERRLTEMGAR